MSSPWKPLEAPLAAERFALFAGSPGETLPLVGMVRRAEVIETFGTGPVVAADGARYGDALILEGITVWIEGYFPMGMSGEPVAEERADTIATFEALRASLGEADYELFLHYEPGSPGLFRKFTQCNTRLFRSQWADPVGMPYQFAAVTSNVALYDLAPGEEP
jgi:hypothetical protein